MLDRSHHVISACGLAFIKSFESFVGYVYDDKVPPVRGKYREWKGEPVKGTLTIGYGHTNAAKHPLKIKKGLRITEADACEILDVDLDDVENDVNRMVKVPMTQGQYDALASLTFNMGSGNLRKSSLLAALNAGNYAKARACFDLYVNSGGMRMNGLVRRRDGEQAMWDARYDEAPEPAPKEVVDHPADVDAPPMSTEDKAAAGVAVVGSLQTVSSGASAAKDVKDNVASLGVWDFVSAHPGLFAGLALLVFWCCWKRWPAALWRYLP